VFALRPEVDGPDHRSPGGPAARATAPPAHPAVSPRQRLLLARTCASRTVHTMVGEVSLSRPYFYCTDCQQGFSPLDDALQCPAPHSMGPAAGRTRLAAEVPFQTAQELFTQRPACR